MNTDSSRSSAVMLINNSAFYTVKLSKVVSFPTIGLMHFFAIFVNSVVNLRNVAVFLAWKSFTWLVIFDILALLQEPMLAQVQFPLRVS